MKRLIKLLIITVVFATVFSSVEAQRAGRSRENMSSNVFRSGNVRSAPSSTNRSNRNMDFGSRNVRENSPRNYNNNVIASHEIGRANTINNNRINTYQQRNEVAVRDLNRRENISRYPSRNVIVERNVTQRNYSSYNNYNRYNNYSRGYNYNRGYNHGGYYPRYIFMTGPRYRVLPRNSLSIYFGGFPYYYNDGFFYGQFGGYYEPLFPPIGIHIGVLPFGYRRIFIGADLFYYYNGIYYRSGRDKQDYEVVDAPMGATVSSLPKGAKSVVLNGEKLYELNGTYYKEDRNSKGETVYTVVGKNGEVNNSNSSDENSVPPASLNSGDVIDQLPEGSKAVTINGEQLFVTPDDVYLKQETDGDMVKYRVVGK